MGVAEALVPVLAVPSMYLLLFILTSLEQWLDAGAQQARARQEPIPATDAVLRPAAPGPLASESGTATEDGLVPAPPGATGQAA